MSIKFRLARHIAFWIALLFYQIAVEFIIPTFLEGATYNVLKAALGVAFAYLPGQFILVYSLLYFIIPKHFLKSRYFSGILLVNLFIILAALANEFSYQLLTSKSIVYFPSGGMHSLGMNRVLAAGGLASFIRVMKFWFEKKYHNTQLEKEKLAAELQILKAQIHPHFLFNTLNNIYSITQNTSPEASDMLLRLSALLRYILYECNLPEIRLTQEFKIINDYISLESIRYGKTLDVNIKLPENTDNHQIAPLLLLPLIENCFKHGTSKMLDQPWINIQADLKENILIVKLMNSRPEYVASESSHSGIGLSNLQKRLEFIYPGKYDLKILPENDIFVVVLKLELSMIRHTKHEPVI